MLEAFLQSLSCVFMLTLLTGAGYWTASRGWYDQTASQLLVRLVNFLSLPCFLFSSVMEKMTHDDLFALFEPMIVPFISIWLVFFASRIFVRIFRIDSLHSGVFSSAFSTSNNMFIGLPVALALFGTDGIKADKAQAPKVFSLATVRRVFSPPLCGFLLAIILIILNLRLPEPIMQAAKYMGGITTPLALLFIGLMIYNIGLRNIRFSRDLVLVLIDRFLISPLLCLAFTILMDVPETIAKVYVIQACLPCVLQIAVLAKFHHADVQFATTCVASTTIASAVTLPLWMMALTALY